MTRRGMGFKLGRGYKNLVPLDVVVHSRSAKGISTYSKFVRPPVKRGVTYHQGVFQNKFGKGHDQPYSEKKTISNLKSIDSVKQEIYTLMYEVKKYKGEQATHKEVMTIVVLTDKAHHLDFLQAHTDWKAVGYWKDDFTDKSFDKEKNTVIQIQFLDTKSEKVGKRLKVLLNSLNRKEIGEWLLYMDTKSIEETSLNLRKSRKKVIE